MISYIVQFHVRYQNCCFEIRIDCISICRIDDLSVISDPNTPMRLNQYGSVKWSPSGIYKVNCESDITYYPLDYQTCDIKLTTSSYTLWEIKLSMEKNVVNLDFYTQNGEWELLSATGMQSDDKARGGESFSSLVYRIHMRRRPLFHVLNTMFPVALMAFLIPLTFKLHVNSGEKIGYSLTVLLAYAVYLSVISENIPSTSVSVCYMCKLCNIICLLRTHCSVYTTFTHLFLPI